MIRRKAKKSLSVFLAFVTMFTALSVGVNIGSVKADAASWNGTNYGGGSVAGYRTFLEAFGIDYDTYMKWMDDHDNDSPNPDYYLGTRYIGYDHRNPHGDCKGAYSYLDVPGKEGLNCTGFVWHVLYKSACLSGASRSQINSLPVMGSVVPTWASLGVYRIYFPTKEAALASGVLEKGDLLWIYGTKDNHNAIFYGENSHHDRFWHSAGPNSLGRIQAPGKFLGMWVAKVTQPNKIELRINAKTPDNNDGGFGAKYCVFDSKEKAEAARKSSKDSAVWDSRIGTIALDSKGCGTLRVGSAPSQSELWEKGIPQTDLSYFSSAAKKVDSSKTYYAVQWSPAKEKQPDTEIRTFTDSGKRTSTGYRIFNFKLPKKVATPAVSKLKSTADGIKIRWGAVKGARKYRVYRRNNQGGWTRIGETSSASMLDSNAAEGHTYTYTVRCVDSDGDFISDFYSPGWKHTLRLLDNPSITSLKSEGEGVRLSWRAVEGAQKYRAYYKGKNGWVRMGETASAEFVDDVVSVGSTYTYTVRCVDKEGDFTSNYNKNGWKHTYTGIAAPQITNLSEDANGVKIKWGSVQGAAKYRVYSKNSSGGWDRIGETSSPEYLDSTVTSGNTYTYTVRCVNSKGCFVSDYDHNGRSCRFNGIPAPIITKIDSEAEGLRISWNAVAGAAKYRVYYKNSRGGWSVLGETPETEILDNVVTAGHSYTYTVRCLGSGGRLISGYDATGRTGTYKGVETPRITSLENTASGVRISWNPVEGAKHYRVFYKGKNGWARLGDTNGASYTDTNVRDGGTYTYTVRCVGEHDNFISSFDAKGSTIQYKK